MFTMANAHVKGLKEQTLWGGYQGWGCRRAERDRAGVGERAGGRGQSRSLSSIHEALGSTLEKVI